jgi:hypothetical protein
MPASGAHGSGKAEPRLKCLERPVHGVGRTKGKRDVPVADGDLFFGGGFAKLGHGGDIERGSQTASVRARLAVNEDRLIGTFKNPDEGGCLRLREFLSRGHTEVDMGNAKLFGLRNLRVIPRRAAVLSAEIDDRLDAVGLLVVGDVGRRRLRGSAQFAGNDRIGTVR